MKTTLKSSRQYASTCIGAANSTERVASLSPSVRYQLWSHGCPHCVCPCLLKDYASRSRNCRLLLTPPLETFLAVIQHSKDPPNGHLWCDQMGRTMYSEHTPTMLNLSKECQNSKSVHLLSYSVLFNAIVTVHPGCHTNPIPE